MSILRRFFLASDPSYSVSHWLHQVIYALPQLHQYIRLFLVKIIWKVSKTEINRVTWNIIQSLEAVFVNQSRRKRAEDGLGTLFFALNGDWPRAKSAQIVNHMFISLYTGLPKEITKSGKYRVDVTYGVNLQVAPYIWTLVWPSLWCRCFLASIILRVFAQPRQ